MALLPPTIAALTPRDGAGHQFVCYADSCSGVAGAPEEAAFARVNAVLARLRPQPQFICFPGDEIIGLSTDEETLRNQWRYWFEREMHWLDRYKIPLYHTTGNHTAYDPASERVFTEVLAHLPRNGPPGQEGLTYFIRRDDLLLVFVNTLWSGHGGEGHVENTWLYQTLSDHADAGYRLVFGHHPVHPVKGHFGPHELGIVPEDGREFWKVLVRQRVLAYVCSHLLTFRWEMRIRRNSFLSSRTCSVEKVTLPFSSLTALSSLVLSLLYFLFRAFHSGPPRRTMTKRAQGLVRGER